MIIEEQFPFRPLQRSILKFEDVRINLPRQRDPPCVSVNTHYIIPCHQQPNTLTNKAIFLNRCFADLNERLKFRSKLGDAGVCDRLIINAGKSAMLSNSYS